jgi:hypothetical protein
MAMDISDGVVKCDFGNDLLMQIETISDLFWCLMVVYSNIDG